MKKIVIAGGSGFLGSSFHKFAEREGWEVVVLTRNPRQSNEIKWDARSIGEWTSHLIDATAIVNFTGRSVNCIYNEENRSEIVNSRIESVRIIDQAIELIAEDKRPKVVIQAASLAIFGDTKELCDEDAQHGEGFSVEVCELWEREFYSKAISGVRKCLLRIGFALGPNGGALEPLRNLTRFFLGGTVGLGDQFVRWLHVEDLNRMILRCIEDSSFEGTFNATGPYPVTNREFMKAMRRAMNRPWSPPAPSLIVKIGARLVLRTESSLALTGRNCIPKRFLKAGFDFKHTDLASTLQTILNQWGY